jgi:hypothetical protein
MLELATNRKLDLPQGGERICFPGVENLEIYISAFPKRRLAR